MQVYKNIAAVQGELAIEGIAKDRNNQQQGYKFRGIDDVYNALAPVLSKHGLCILPRIIIASMSCQITREAAIFSYHLGKDGDRKPVAVTIPFTWTPCNYGGRRVWFTCQCGHRAGKIFFEGERYGCRNCFNLTYQSRKDCQINRAWGKIYEIGKRLKLVESRDKSLYYLPPDRPKWMQQQRYERLCCDLQFWYYMKNKAIVADFENLFPGRLETLQ